MNNIAIQIEGLGKQYRIGRRNRYRTFRDALTGTITAPFQRVSGLLRGNASAAANMSEKIWALKDISFTVQQGEAVGLIGHNGAGKSTLLKILSRITEPTLGRAEVRGRVGALLEVSTGFHQELTGRENVYLNGAILGMPRRDIDRKFDEIVAFSEIENYIDTPVKYYSSGMGLRLGFAVAAHLEPEILIIDEVLAVGDYAFQVKCMGKVGEAAAAGRTVMFVSHNMEAMQRLCRRIVVLNRGGVVFDGEAREAVDAYYGQLAKATNMSDITLVKTSIEHVEMYVNGVSVRNQGTMAWDVSQPLRVSVHVTMTQPAPSPLVDIGIFRKDGLRLVVIQSDRNSTRDNQDFQMAWDVDFEIFDPTLASQSIFIDLGIKKASGEYIVHWRNTCDIAVVNPSNVVVAPNSIFVPQLKIANQPAVASLEHK